VRKFTELEPKENELSGLFAFLSGRYTELETSLSQTSNRRTVMIAAMSTISGDRVPVIICD